MNIVVGEASTERSMLNSVSAFETDSMVVEIERATTASQLYNVLSKFQQVTGSPRFLFIVAESGKTAITALKTITNWPHGLFDQAVRFGMIENLMAVGFKGAPDVGSCAGCPSVMQTGQLLNNESPEPEFLDAVASAKLDTINVITVPLAGKTDLRIICVLDGMPEPGQAEKTNAVALFGAVGNKMLSLGAQENSKAPVLSKRETECIRWTAEGKTSYEIGIILGLSENTINNYIASVTKKMGAVNRSHMISLAFRTGIIT